MKSELLNHSVNVRRFCFYIIWFLFCRFTPRYFSSFRVLILRIFGAQIGANCVVYGSTRIWAPWNLVLGNSSCLGPRVYVYNVSPIVIGSRVIISQDTVLCTPSHNFNVRSFDLVSAPIEIGDDCWVAAYCFIGGGCIIGPCIVVGARAVLRSGSLSKPGVYVGNPAVFVKDKECIQYSF